MKITFLGTGTSQGVPVIGCNCSSCRSDDPHDKRLRSSILLEEAGTVVVIDTGPDFRQQMLNACVNKLDAVVYTHEHRDHIAGLDDVRSFNFLQNRPMDLYAERRVLDSIRISFPYIFSEKKYPGVPLTELHLIDINSFVIREMEFTPIRMMHHQLPVLGFRVGDFAYLVDSNYIPDEEKEKLTGLKYLVIGAIRREKHLSHFNLEEALQLALEIKAGTTFLTHISHQMGPEKTWRGSLPDSVMPAYDGLLLEW